MKKDDKPKVVRDRAFYQAIGAKGGKATMDRHGRKHFEDAGAKGGASLLAARGTEFFQMIGKLKGLPHDHDQS